MNLLCANLVGWWFPNEKNELVIVSWYPSNPVMVSKTKLNPSHNVKWQNIAPCIWLSRKHFSSSRMEATSKHRTQKESVFVDQKSNIVKPCQANNDPKCNLFRIQMQQRGGYGRMSCLSQIYNDIWCQFPPRILLVTQQLVP